MSENVIEVNKKFVEFLEEGNEDEVEKLFNEHYESINLSTKNYKGETALILAIKNSRLSTEMALCHEEYHGTNVFFEPDANGRTPLMYAAEYNHELVAYICEEKAKEKNISKKDKDGKTAVMYAMEAKNKIAVEMFFDKQYYGFKVDGNYIEDVDVKQKDKDGKNLLMYACKNGFTEIAKLLIDKFPILLKERDEFGNTVFFCAAIENLYEIVYGLLERGVAKINEKDKVGYTALMLVAEMGNSEILKQLISAGADLNAKGNGDWTALIYAAIYGNFEVIKQLISAGADVKAKDAYGRTALTWAVQKGCEKIVTMLKKAEARQRALAAQKQSLIGRIPYAQSINFSQNQDSESKTQKDLEESRD